MDKGQPLKWQPIEHSSLVDAAAFDDAADRIFIREHGGAEWVFEDCDEYHWRLLRSEGSSAGSFVMHVLRRHPHRQL